MAPAIILGKFDGIIRQWRHGPGHDSGYRHQPHRRIRTRQRFFRAGHGRHHQRSCGESQWAVPDRPGRRSGNAANGLELQITATAPFSSAVNFTKGVGAAISDVASQVTGVTGVIKTAEDSINSQITNIQTQISNWQTKLTNYQDQLTTQFNNMESALSKLENQGSAISAMLSSLTNNSSSSSSSSKSSKFIRFIQADVPVRNHNVLLADCSQPVYGQRALMPERVANSNLPNS